MIDGFAVVSVISVLLTLGTAVFRIIDDMAEKRRWKWWPWKRTWQPKTGSRASETKDNVEIINGRMLQHSNGRNMIRERNRIGEPYYGFGLVEQLYLALVWWNHVLIYCRSRSMLSQTTPA